MCHQNSRMLKQRSIIRDLKKHKVVKQYLELGEVILDLDNHVGLTPQWNARKRIHFSGTFTFGNSSHPSRKQIAKKLSSTTQWFYKWLLKMRWKNIKLFKNDRKIE